VRILIIGDPHAQISNLDDLDLIFARAKKVTAEKQISAIFILGDCFHTHSVLRQEVIKFYKKGLDGWKDCHGNSPNILVGNHDLIGPKNNQTNAITLTLGDMANVIDAPTVVSVLDESGPVDFLCVPYMPNSEDFIDVCRSHLCIKTLVCHQTFDGSQYENGFYAPDGIDHNKIPQKMVISGHIHKSQNIGKVFYAGTPRALTASDANEHKGFWIMDTSQPSDNAFEFITTNDIAKVFKAIEIKEGDFDGQPIIIDWKEKDDVRLTISGSEEFYELFLKNHKHLQGRAKIIPNIKRCGKNSSIKIETKDGNIRELLKKYVLEIHEMADDLREGVWTTISKIL